MVKTVRPLWQNLIYRAWLQRPIVWLTGVRRVGKTTLAKSLEGKIRFLNCDLPSVRAELADPESFLKSVDEDIIVFDEIHQIEDPALVLKIAADEFSHKKVLATGSSTLAATHKFKDSLTGRKAEVHLTPALVDELSLFETQNLKKRLLNGGLPEALLAEKPRSDFYVEWMDSFFARDVQELFHIEKRQPFLNALEWLLMQNGGLIELTELARASGISRPTAVKYMEALEITHAIHVIRPFSGGHVSEVVKQPKIYGFDTGFVCHAKSIRELRPDDCGTLLENLVVDTFKSLGVGRSLHFWRDKQQHEVDFVYKKSREELLTLECKWSKNHYSADNLRIFRNRYPSGANWVVCGELTSPIKQRYGDLEVTFIPVAQLRQHLIQHLSLGDASIAIATIREDRDDD